MKELIILRKDNDVVEIDPSKNWGWLFVVLHVFTVKSLWLHGIVWLSLILELVVLPAVMGDTTSILDLGSFVAFCVGYSVYAYDIKALELIHQGYTVEGDNKPRNNALVYMMIIAFGLPVLVQSLNSQFPELAGSSAMTCNDTTALSIIRDIEKVSTTTIKSGYTVSQQVGDQYLALGVPNHAMLCKAELSSSKEVSYFYWSADNGYSYVQYTFPF